MQNWKLQIEKAKTRAVNLMESILQLSNLDLISIYMFKGENSRSGPATSSVQNEILGPALSEVQVLFFLFDLN
jgi:hypothetical protein